MKRTTALVEYANASPDVRVLYDESMRVLGITQVPNWIKAQGANPKVLRSNWEKFRNTVLEGEVSLLLKQLILFVISSRADNRYCLSAHGHAALSLDPSLSCEDLACLSRGESYAGLPRAFKVAIDVVSRVALQPTTIEAADFDVEGTLYEAGFSSHEIDELLAQADFGAMFNIIMAVNDVPPDLPYPPPARQE